MASPSSPLEASSSSSVFPSVSQVEEYVSVSESSENVGGLNANAGKKSTCKKSSNRVVQKNSHAGFNILKQMERADVKPDSITFSL